jgi:protein TonB
MMFSLAVSMGIALLCLSWTRFELQTYTSTSLEVAELNEIDVVRTMHQPPRPSPKLPRHIEAVPEPVPTVEMPPEIETVIEPTITIGKPDTGMIESAPVIKPPLPVAQETDEPPFIVVEQMPRFPGCEDFVGSNLQKYQCGQQKLLEYIYDKVRYPKVAREAGLEGPVVVRFVVEKDGRISNPEVLRDIGGGCGAEVERVVKSMNAMDQLWTPGKQRGVPVRVQFTLPVYFKLK